MPHRRPGTRPRFAPTQQVTGEMHSRCAFAPAIGTTQPTAPTAKPCSVRSHITRRALSLHRRPSWRQPNANTPNKLHVPRASAETVKSTQSDSLDGTQSSPNPTTSPNHRKLEAVRVDHITDYFPDAHVYDSPVKRPFHHFVDGELVVAQSIVEPTVPEQNHAYLRAGPYRRLYHSKEARAAIVTCGGVSIYAVRCNFVP